MQVQFLSDGHLNNIGRYSGQYFNRAVLVDSKWVVMNVKNTSTIIDYKVYKSDCQPLTWTLNSAGYVYNAKESTYLHQKVLPNNDFALSVDHKGIKKLPRGIRYDNGMQRYEYQWNTKYENGSCCEI